MHSPDIDCARETYRGKLELSMSPTDHVVGGTMPTIQKLSLEDTAEQTAHHQAQAQSPLRMISSAVTAARDITTKFRAATSGKPYLPYSHRAFTHLYSSRDRTARQGCLLYTFRVRGCAGGTTQAFCCISFGKLIAKSWCVL